MQLTLAYNINEDVPSAMEKALTGCNRMNFYGIKAIRN